MVDIDSKRIVDMLESRESAEVTEWLKTYPNIEVVSRDGSPVYAKAINEAHPEAVQISDRFHLIKNLTDSAKEYLSELFSVRFRVAAGQDDVFCGGYWNRQPLRADLAERLHMENTVKKEAKAREVRELAARGIPMVKAAELAGVNPATARRYAKEGFNPKSADYGNKKPGKINPYTKTIDQMLCDKRTFKDIEEAIRALGYDGTASTIRMYATRKRRTINNEVDGMLAGTELIERKWLAQLLYKAENLNVVITEGQLARVIKEHPIVGRLCDIVRSFKEILSTKSVDSFDSWVEKARELGIGAINRFVNGIVRDIEAVKNAIRYDYNNGLAEGSVNKLKLLKRIMYGRAQFDTLRYKTLKREAKINRFK